MALTHDEVTAIKEEILAECKQVFVQIESCNDTQKHVDKKFASDDKRIEIISHDFAVIKKLMWAVASASIGSLVVAFFELILK